MNYTNYRIILTRIILFNLLFFTLKSFAQDRKVVILEQEVARKVVIDLENYRFTKLELEQVYSINSSYEEKFKNMNQLLKIKEEEVVLLENIIDNKETQIELIQSQLKSSKKVNKIVIVGVVALGTLLLLSK